MRNGYNTPYDNSRARLWGGKNRVIGFNIVSLQIDKNKSMAEVKNLFKVIHLIALLFWGLNIIEIIKKTFLEGINTSLGSVFEDTIKLFMAIAGLVYFIIKIIHAYKSNKLDRIIKQQQIDKTAFENMMRIKDYGRANKKQNKDNETK